MKLFKKVYIEITNICNLKCDFCPPTKRKPEFMAVETFSDILDQIKPHTGYIYLHVKGEPLLHPELDKLLDISYEKGFKVNITTNGTLIDRAGEMLLTKPALRQIHFSLHSIGGNKLFGDKDKYLSNIISFIKKAMEKTGIYISLRLWNLDSNNQSENNKNEHILKTIEDAFELPFRIAEAEGADRGIKLAERVYLNQAHEFKWPDLNESEESASGFCYGLRNQAAILVDGTVVPCCLDGDGVIKLGNIKNMSFLDIIESQRANDIFNGFTGNKAVEELCRKCGFRTRFD